MRRALVTGMGGFVGANLARRLLGDGVEVHAFVRPDHDEWRLEEIAHDAKVHAVDLRDDDGVRRAVEQIRPDWIFHLAAHGAYPFQTDVREMVATNVVGTINLLQAAVRVGFEAFVNTGSSSEYGRKDHAPSEGESIQPNSDYAITKASATHFCQHVARSAGVRVPTLRLYSVYGPWEEPSRLMARLLVLGLGGRLPPMADPRTARDYVYVDDVTDAYVLAATTDCDVPGAVYNVGTGVQTTLATVVETVRSALGVRAKPLWDTMPGRAWDTDVWVADPTAIKASLGWTARHTVAEGLHAMAAWYLDHPGIHARYERPDLLVP